MVTNPIEGAVLAELKYIDVLEPEYYILSTAPSILGYKHSPETLEKMRKIPLRLIKPKESKTGLGLPGRKLTENDRVKRNKIARIKKRKRWCNG